jgi:alkylated DNA nucleotide flippase Atl1
METLASRKRLLPELAQRKALVVFPHDPNVPWVRLVESGGKITTQSVT